MPLKPLPLAAALAICGSALVLGAAATQAAGAETAGVTLFAPRAALAGPPAAAARPAAPWSFNRAASPATASAPGGAATGPDEPNLGALRFYAGQNDLARVAAEIRLLRAKYPGWEPPTDLFTENRTGESEQPLWDLFAKHDLAGVTEAIAQRQQQTPGWQPSADLGSKLATALAYDELVRASEAKEYGTVIELAAAHRDLLGCGTVDAIWRTAEAMILTDDEAHAADAYRYVLDTCPGPNERLATVQKAAALLKNPEVVDGLIRLGKRLPNGQSEFADIALDGVRQRIGASAAGKTEVQPNPAELDRLAARAHAPGGAKDAELLGWYALSRKDFAAAETWFRAAMTPTPTAKSAEGLVLALRDGGKTEEAVRLAPQYAALGPLNRKLMMEVLVANLADAKQPATPDQLAAMAGAIDAEKSADAAQALGWSRFKAADVAGAAAWFKKSLAWQPSEAAAVGQMLAARRLKNAADYASVVAAYKATYPRVATLDAVMHTASRPVSRPVRQARRGTRRLIARGDGWDQNATAIVKTFEGGHLDEALAMMDARRAAHPEPAGLSVVRGWALYKKGDWDGAKRVFTDAGRRGMSDEAGNGLRQIELGYTNPRYR